MSVDVDFYTDFEIKALAFGDRFLTASRTVTAFTREQAKTQFGPGLARVGIDADTAIQVAFNIAEAAMINDTGGRAAPVDRYAYWLLDKMQSNVEKIKSEDEKQRVLQQRNEMQALLTNKDSQTEAIDTLRRLRLIDKKLLKKSGAPAEIEKYGSITELLTAIKQSMPNLIGESNKFEIYFAAHQQDAVANVPYDDSKSERGNVTEHWCTHYSPDNSAKYYPEGPVFFMFEKGRKAPARDAYAFTVDRMYSSDQIGELQNKFNSGTEPNKIPLGAMQAIEAAERNITEAKQQDGPWVGWGGIDLKTYMPDNLVERVSWIGKGLDDVPQMVDVLRNRNKNVVRNTLVSLSPMLAAGKSIDEMMRTVEEKALEGGEWRHFMNLNALATDGVLRDPQGLFKAMLEDELLDADAMNKLIGQYVYNSKYRKFFKDDTDFDNAGSVLLGNGIAALKFGGTPRIRVELDVSRMMDVMSDVLRHDKILASFATPIKQQVDAYGISQYMDDKKFKWIDYAGELYKGGIAKIDWNRHAPGASDEAKQSNPIDLDGDEAFIKAKESGLITDDSIVYGLAKLVNNIVGGCVKNGADGAVEFVRKLRGQDNASIRIGLGRSPAVFYPNTTQPNSVTKIFAGLKQSDLIDFEKLYGNVANLAFTLMGGHVKGGVEELKKHAEVFYARDFISLGSVSDMKKMNELVVGTEGLYNFVRRSGLIDDDSMVKALAVEMYPKWENFVSDASELLPVLHEFAAHNRIVINWDVMPNGEYAGNVRLINTSNEMVFDAGRRIGVFNNKRVAAATSRTIFDMFGGYIMGGVEALQGVSDEILNMDAVILAEASDGKVVIKLKSERTNANIIAAILKREKLIDNVRMIGNAAEQLISMFSHVSVDAPDEAAFKAASQLSKNNGVSLVPGIMDRVCRVEITASSGQIIDAVKNTGMIDNSKVIAGAAAAVKGRWGDYVADDEERLNKMAQDLVENDNARLDLDEGTAVITFESQTPSVDYIQPVREKMRQYRLTNPAKIKEEMYDRVAVAIEKILNEPKSDVQMGSIIDESKMNREAAAQIIARYLVDSYKPMEVNESNAHEFLDAEDNKADMYINKLYQQGDPHYLEWMGKQPTRKSGETLEQYEARTPVWRKHLEHLQSMVTRKNILEAAVMLNIANRNGMQTFSSYYWDWQPRGLTHLPRPSLELLPLRPGEADPYAKLELEEQPKLPFGAETVEIAPIPPAGGPGKKKRKPRKKQQPPGAVTPEAPAGDAPVVAYRLSSWNF